MRSSKIAWATMFAQCGWDQDTDPSLLAPDESHHLRRGSFRSAQHLRQTIRHYIAANNQDPKPFVWAASANLILGKVSHLCGELR